MSSSINLGFINNEIEEATYIGSPEGDLTPDSMYPKNARKLRGFNWRGDERILSVEDLFKDDPPLELVKIKGLEERVLESEDEELRSISKVKKTTKPKLLQPEITPIKKKKHFKKKFIPKFKTSKKRASLIKKD